jgi:hypothetical protein
VAEVVSGDGNLRRLDSCRFMPGVVHVDRSCFFHDDNVNFSRVSPTALSACQHCQRLTSDAFLPPSYHLPATFLPPSLPSLTHHYGSQRPLPFTNYSTRALLSAMAGQNVSTVCSLRAALF